MPKKKKRTAVTGSRRRQMAANRKATRKRLARKSY